MVTWSWFLLYGNMVSYVTLAISDVTYLLSVYLAAASQLSNIIY